MRRHGGEADLIIGDDMQRAAGAIANQLAHRQRFINHALSGKGGIAMQQNAHHRTSALDVAAHILTRAHLACHHWVNRFQMRRIGLQRKVNLVPGNIDIGAGTQMVFHIARAFDVVRIG